MAEATFYLLNADLQHKDPNVIEWLACTLAGLKWRQGHKVVIACQQREQAEQIDIALWKIDPQQFIPHALVGEPLFHKAPIRLCWSSQLVTTGDVLISLLSQFTPFASHFTQVIEFVADDSYLKQQARERYSAYRKAGFQLTTTQIPLLT